MFSPSWLNYTFTHCQEQVWLRVLNCYLKPQLPPNYKSSAHQQRKSTRCFSKSRMPTTKQVHGTGIAVQALMTRVAVPSLMPRASYPLQLNEEKKGHKHTGENFGAGSGLRGGDLPNCSGQSPREPPSKQRRPGQREGPFD